jgi:protein tyrosine phosphatase (PTP) superfamily phosphohydrolase (DUF442 family)
VVRLAEATCVTNTEPVPISDIRNFVSVSDTLATAGQPTELQLQELKAAGFDAVINLGLLDPRYCLPDEAASVAALGMVYHHIPVIFHEPKADDFAAFRSAVQSLRDRKLFVHCAMNFRVSCFVALLGEAELGWTRAQANAHVQRLWEPDQVWSAFLTDMRRQLELA